MRRFCAARKGKDHGACLQIRRGAAQNSEQAKLLPAGQAMPAAPDFIKPCRNPMPTCLRPVQKHIWRVQGATPGQGLCRRDVGAAIGGLPEGEAFRDRAAALQHDERAVYQL